MSSYLKRGLNNFLTIGAAAAALSILPSNAQAQTPSSCLVERLEEARRPKNYTTIIQPIEIKVGDQPKRTVREGETVQIQQGLEAYLYPQYGVVGGLRVRDDVMFKSDKTGKYFVDDAGNRIRSDCFASANFSTLKPGDKVWVEYTIENQRTVGATSGFYFQLTPAPAKPVVEQPKCDCPEPQTIEKIVEVPVEKIVEKEKIIEKIVAPKPKPRDKTRFEIGILADGETIDGSQHGISLDSFLLGVRKNGKVSYGVAVTAGWRHGNGTNLVQNDLKVNTGRQVLDLTTNIDSDYKIIELGVQGKAEFGKETGVKFGVLGGVFSHSYHATNVLRQESRLSSDKSLVDKFTIECSPNSDLLLGYAVGGLMTLPITFTDSPHFRLIVGYELKVLPNIGFNVTRPGSSQEFNIPGFVPKTRHTVQIGVAF